MRISVTTTSGRTASIAVSSELAPVHAGRHDGRRRRSTVEQMPASCSASQTCSVTTTTSQPQIFDARETDPRSRELSELGVEPRQVRALLKLQPARYERRPGRRQEVRPAGRARRVARARHSLARGGSGARGHLHQVEVGPQVGRASPEHRGGRGADVRYRSSAISRRQQRDRRAPQRRDAHGIVRAARPWRCGRAGRTVSCVTCSSSAISGPVATASAASRTTSRSRADRERVAPAISATRRKTAARLLRRAEQRRTGRRRRAVIDLDGIALHRARGPRRPAAWSRVMPLGAMRIANVPPRVARMFQRTPKSSRWPSGPLAPASAIRRACA